MLVFYGKKSFQKQPLVFIQENEELVAYEARIMGTNIVDFEAPRFTMGPRQFRSEVFRRHIDVLTKEEIREAVEKYMGGQNLRERNAVSRPRSEGSSPVENPGGIDFNPGMLNLRQEGQGADFEMDASLIESLQPDSVYGLQPVIINIIPITNFMPLLGMTDSEDGQRPRQS
jgi:hypothetical protein